MRRKRTARVENVTRRKLLTRTEKRFARAENVTHRKLLTRTKKLFARADYTVDTRLRMRIIFVQTCRKDLIWLCT